MTKISICCCGNTPQLQGKNGNRYAVECDECRMMAIGTTAEEAVKNWNNAMSQLVGFAVPSARGLEGAIDYNIALSRDLLAGAQGPHKHKKENEMYPQKSYLEWQQTWKYEYDEQETDRNYLYGALFAFLTTVAEKVGWKHLSNHMHAYYARYDKSPNRWAGKFINEIRRNGLFDEFTSRELHKITRRFKPGEFQDNSPLKFPSDEARIYAREYYNKLIPECHKNLILIDFKGV